MLYKTLKNGVKMPMLGFGVFQVTDPEGCRKAVLCALENGYRSIDTAQAYGNEEAVGQAIKDSGIPRDRKSTRLNSSHRSLSRMPSSA